MMFSRVSTRLNTIAAAHLEQVAIGVGLFVFGPGHAHHVHAPSLVRAYAFRSWRLVVSSRVTRVLPVWTL